MTKGAPPPPTNRDYPVYPEITRAQWEVLVAWTDQRCAHMMDAADFIADLSPEAREFLREAGPEQIKRINNSLDFFTNSKAVWRFFWIGGGVLLGFVAGAAQIWKTFSEYFMVKLK